MDTSWWLLNVAYAIYVISPGFKDILRLRVVLLAATFVFIIYGLTSGIYSVAWWNIPFGLMHAYQIALLVQARYGTHLSENEETYRAQLFPSLDAGDFAALWSIGRDEHLQPNEVLTFEGEQVEDVMLILSGAADVELGRTPTGERRFVRLRPHSLVGEMSMMNGGPACATVTTSGPTSVRRFPRKQLLELGEDRPAVKDAALVLIGQQLAAKIPTAPTSMAGILR